MKLQLAYPVKPMVITQTFGNDPAYYARFLDQFGKPEKGHMGVDFRAPHGTPVYAACDGFVHYEKDSHGGEGMVIRTAAFDYGDGQAIFHIINWHLCGDTDPKYPSPIALDGKEYAVKAGQLIGYADNTGAPYESTGDHLHFGLMAIALSGLTLNPDNGFNGCIDSTPYFNGNYAQDLVPAAPAPAPAPVPPSVPPPSTITPGLSASDQIAVLAAQKEAAGNTEQANVLYALAKFLKTFGD